MLIFVILISVDKAILSRNINNSRKVILSMAAATIRGTRTRTQIISDDCHRASASAVRVVRVVSTADSMSDQHI